MRAGSLNIWLDLFALSAVVDSFGAESASYDFVKRVHAERVNMSGRRSEQVSEHFADYSVRFNVRDVHGVREGWRVRPFRDGGEYLYEVLAVEPNLARGFVTLICERVNE